MPVLPGVSFLANYKLTVQYDGTSFYGFQIQPKPEIITVQGELQKVISMIFNKEIKINAAGRTDTGVHALGQVVNFQVDKDMDVKKLTRALNRLLNRAVTVSNIETVPEDFHARYSAKQRRYIYILDNSPQPSALLRNRAYHYGVPLDISKMKEAIVYFRGEHDFSRFAKNLKDIDKPIRSLDEAEIVTYDEYVGMLNGYKGESGFVSNSFTIGHKMTTSQSKDKNRHDIECNDSQKVFYSQLMGENASGTPAIPVNGSEMPRTQGSAGETPAIPGCRCYKNSCNYISQILLPQRNFIFFYFSGMSFLHSMVRLMVGNLIQVGLGKLTSQDIKEMLKPNFKIKSSAANVPGSGLYLVDVVY